MVKFFSGFPSGPVAGLNPHLLRAGGRGENIPAHRKDSSQFWTKSKCVLYVEESFVWVGDVGSTCFSTGGVVEHFFGFF